MSAEKYFIYNCLGAVTCVFMYVMINDNKSHVINSLLTNVVAYQE